MQTALETGSPGAAHPFAETLAGKATLAAAGSLLVAACAHLSVPLPFTPVPLTLSDFAVLLVGLTLTPSVAFAALALYLLEGVAGAPVFSSAAFPDLLHRFMVTGGYLFSYPFAAALVSAVRRAFGRGYGGALLAAACGSALVMACGVLWLAVSLHLGAGAAVTKGVLPFLPGQAVKVLCAAGLAVSVRRLQTR